MPPKKIQLTPALGTSLIKIGRSYYALREEKFKKGHTTKLTWEKIKISDYRKKIKTVAKKILEKGEPDRDVILQQALTELSLDDLEKIEKSLPKKKPKVGKGCLFITVDGIEIPIISRRTFLD